MHDNMTNSVGHAVEDVECGRGRGGGGVLNVYQNRGSAPGHKNHMDISYRHKTTNCLWSQESHGYFSPPQNHKFSRQNNQLYPMSDDILTSLRVKLPVAPINTSFGNTWIVCFCRELKIFIFVASIICIFILRPHTSPKGVVFH